MDKVIIPEIVESNYDKVISLAIEQKADLATIEKFMDLRDRWEKNEARKAYYVAMAAFKANPPEIEKDKHVKYTTQKGVTEYDHASLGNVTQRISSALGSQGLSAAWKTAQNAQKITVTCRISHSLGYGEETSLEASHDDSGGKNAIQSLGSTITYLERYTLLALTGLATLDQDDDGKGSEEIKYLTEAEAVTIISIVTDKQVDLKKFLAYMKAESIETILESDYQKAINALKVAKGAAK
jgi:hypothetical protein